MVGFLSTGSRNSSATDSHHPDEALAPYHADRIPVQLSPDTSASKSQSTGRQNDARHAPLHFFSLPHWTRKILPASASPRRRGAMPSDELGVFSRSPSKLMLDKELPPTPPKTQRVAGNLDPAATSLDQPLSPPASMDRSIRSSTASGAIIPSTSAESRNSRPTMHLHNAPHVPVPRGVNTVSFVTPSPTNIDQPDLTLPLRHSKSSQSFRKQACGSTQPLGLAERARGLSVYQRPSCSKLPEQKYAEPPLIGIKGEGQYVRQVSKKPSRQLLSVPSESLSLPALQPTAPFHIDFHSDAFTNSQQSPQRSVSRLTRSHSERVCRRLSASNSDAPALPKIPSAFTSSRFHSTSADPTSHPTHPPRSILRRPATADSTRSRTRSFFTLSSQRTPVPSSQTPHFENALSSLASPTSVNHVNTRPRSATNPPLLHRLSLNFFASSNSPAKTGTIPDSFITASPVSRSRSPLLSVPPEDLRPHQDESPDSFLQRLTSLVGKADIAGLLASRYITSFFRFSLF